MMIMILVNYTLFVVPLSLTNLGQVMENVKDAYTADEVRLVIMVSDFINMEDTPDMVTSAADLRDFGIQVSINGSSRISSKIRIYKYFTLSSRFRK